jgi:hypothetical protein
VHAYTLICYLTDHEATQESRWSHPHEDYFKELYWTMKQQQQPQEASVVPR